MVMIMPINNSQKICPICHTKIGNLEHKYLQKYILDDVWVCWWCFEHELEERC